MKVLVTGGAGFIGSAVIRHIIQNTQDDVVNVDKLTFAVQPKPDGLAQAFVIGESFIGTDDVCLALGDNILFGQAFGKQLKHAVQNLTGATVFCLK